MQRTNRLSRQRAHPGSRSASNSTAPDPPGSANSAAKCVHRGPNAERRDRSPLDLERALRALCREVELQARDKQSRLHHSDLTFARGASPKASRDKDTSTRIYIQWDLPASEYSAPNCGSSLTLIRTLPIHNADRFLRKCFYNAIDQTDERRHKSPRARNGATTSMSSFPHRLSKTRRQNLAT